jgi:hypothetical protein
MSSLTAQEALSPILLCSAFADDAGNINENASEKQLYCIYIIEQYSMADNSLMKKELGADGMRHAILSKWFGDMCQCRSNFPEKCQ